MVKGSNIVCKLNQSSSMEPLKKIADIDINNSQTLLCGKCVESYLNASKPWMSNGTIVGISCCQKSVSDSRTAYMLIL